MRPLATTWHYLVSHQAGYTVYMYSNPEKPSSMEVRVIERDGRRWLQQYRRKPDGMAYQYEWVDICEVLRTTGTVTKLR